MSLKIKSKIIDENIHQYIFDIDGFLIEEKKQNNAKTLKLGKHL